MTTTHLDQQTLERHAAAGGDACTWDGELDRCITCGVHGSTCDECTGIGYHREGCPILDCPEMTEAPIDAYGRCGISHEQMVAQCGGPANFAKLMAKRGIPACEECGSYGTLETVRWVETERATQWDPAEGAMLCFICRRDED